MSTKLKFIRLKTLDAECRCCGKGSKEICQKCWDMLHAADGYAFLIELKDSSTIERKKPTGYQIAFRASQVKDAEQPDGVMKPGIYFIRQTQLKEFLGDDYNSFKSSSIPTRVNGRLLEHAPSRRNHAHHHAAASSRRTVELPHR